ncbi:MAG: F0F1 ATP synthase subunit A [Mogibacterium sp.]|nr:F0F1 ATP synthase subunit A [Mogibacterium sp.]
MDKKKKRKSLILFGVLTAVFLVAGLTTGTGAEHGDIKELMKDAVLHETGTIRLFGLEVNPGLISAFSVTAFLLIIAVILRLTVIPKFQLVPGKAQLVIEELVGLFRGLARTNSPHRNKFLGAYIFTAGVYIFTSTCFELLGLQAVTSSGHSITLPAPLSDINGAICMGVLSFCVILGGGIVGNQFKGFVNTIKDISLPISMSFRLFGAMLSGALVMELVYHYVHLSIVLPVVVSVLFTLLHALIQAYVLTMLTSVFYGEASEPSKPKDHGNAPAHSEAPQLTEMEVVV